MDALDVRVLLDKWHYIYARPLLHRDAVERYMQLHEQGAEQYACRVLAEGYVWRPWWRKRDGRLGFGR